MNIKEIAIQCLKDEAEALLEQTAHIDENFERAVEMMFRCRGKVIITGVGKNSHIGAKIAATLSSTGTPSFFINPLDVFHGDLGVMTLDDVVIAISNSGQTDELLRFIPMLQHSDIPIIGISGNPKSLLAKYSTVHININVKREACPMNLVPTSSTTATLAMGDALAIALMEKRNFKPKDFAQFHPGGELGRRLLTTAEDVMRTTDLPVMPEDTNLIEAVSRVSQGKLGLGVATDQNGVVLGLITDGDIRRAMERWQGEFFQHTMADLMTRTPKMVSPKMRIADIQKLMNRYKVHSVLVVDGGQRLLGVVDHYACMV